MNMRVGVGGGLQAWVECLGLGNGHGRGRRQVLSRFLHHSCAYQRKRSYLAALALLPSAVLDGACDQSNIWGALAGIAAYGIARNGGLEWSWQV